jgi:cellulose synthase/poly-beta-1,6-N-acetylglucosamine synthase-like glycosyltransferase
MILSILIVIYIIAAFLLAIYAFNAWVLTFLYFKHRCTPPMRARERLIEVLPAVTVQLPIFNEALVVERLIDAIVRLDYPAHLLQIQVLDDSTDETTGLAEARIERHRRRGVNLELVRRPDRSAFKAGALKHGLKTATGEFIAIFDADFVPDPDFLKRTLPYFIKNSELGFIQTRWGHLNRSYSPLTAAQALALDGHFAIEQTARNRSGLLINFNGAAGVWRRACIEAAGGWQGDTISEDFDLSYRAQMAGWGCLFLPDVVAPAEIPPQLAAFKRQQFRWAKGSIQCLKKLGWRVLRARLAWPVKLQALVHLSSYLVHPLMVLLTVITPILIMTGATAKIRFPLIYLSLVSLGPPLLYLVAQAGLFGRNWWRNYKAMPLLVLLGSGIALSNTRAVVEALLGVGNVFRRTPKFNLKSTSDRWQHSAYRLPLDGLVIGELGLGLYSLWGAWFAATNGQQFAVPFILLYAFGFGYVGWQGLWETRTQWRPWLEARFRRPTRRASSSKPVGVER